MKIRLTIVLSLLTAALVATALLPLSDTQVRRSPATLPEPDVSLEIETEVQAPAVASSRSAVSAGEAPPVTAPSREPGINSALEPGDPEPEAQTAQPADTAYTNVIDMPHIMQLDAVELQYLVSTGTSEQAQAAAWQMGNLMSLSQADVDTLLARLAASTVEQVELRQTILWALSLRQDLIPIDTVIDYANHDPVASVRRTAMRSISTIQQPEVTEALHYNATLDSSPQNRSEGIFYLSLHLDDETSAQVATSALPGETDPDVRRSWVNLIGAKPSAENTVILGQILNDGAETADVRQMAAEMLIESSLVSLDEIVTSTTLPDANKENLVAMYAASPVQSHDPEHGADPH